MLMSRGLTFGEAYILGLIFQILKYLDRKFLLKRLENFQINASLHHTKNAEKIEAWSPLYS